MPDEPKKPFSQQLASALAAEPKSAAPPPAAPAPVAQEPKIEAKSPTPASAPSAATATQADPDDEIIAGKRPAKGDDFKRVKAAATDANRRATELQAKHEAAAKELEELRKAPKYNAELIKTLERERDEFKAKFEQVAVEISPERQAAHSNRLNAVVETVKALAGDNAETIMSIFAMPEGRRKRELLAEAVEDMDAFTVADLSAAGRAYTAAMTERQREIAKAGETLKLVGEERAKAIQAQRDEHLKGFDNLLRKRSTPGDEANPMFVTKEGDGPEVQAWNAGVAERAQVARAIFSGEFSSTEEKAEAAQAAACYPGVLARLKTSEARVAELESELQRSHGAAPRIGASGSGNTGKKLTFSERMMQAVGG